MHRSLSTIAAVALLAAGCHETIRVRTPQGGQPIRETGSCDDRTPNASETCTEHEETDATMTAVAIGAVVGLVVLSAFAINYADNHCPIC